jgi:WhiB family redox-sensing transcriptional regulator
VEDIERLIDYFESKNDWMAQAACRGAPQEMWFTPGVGTTDEHSLPGITACWTVCPVRVKCLEWSMAPRSKAGIFGGLTTEQRRRLRVRKSGLRSV